MRLARLHVERVVETVPRRLHAGRRRRTGLMADIAADQRAGHAVNNVGFEVLVVVDEDLRDQRLEARLIAEDVQVRRPVDARGPAA